MYQADPGLRHFLDNAYGYVVFPNVGSGAAGIGGSYGHGEVYQQGKFIGYADISQWTIGAQLGGQSFGEVIAFERPWSLRQFEAGQTTFDANASAVAVKAGADATAAYSNGVAVFTQAGGGLMLQAAIGGQTFSFASSNLNIAPPVASTDDNGNSNEQQQ
jgi:lipid-binding SYLF domain-containing protein